MELLYKYKENFIKEADNVSNHMDMLLGLSYANMDATIFNIEARDKIKSYSDFILYPKTNKDEIKNQLILDGIQLIIENELEKLNYEIDYDKEEPPEDDYLYLCEIKTYINIMNCKCNSNIYRQSFISLITLFEATLFDMLNIIINRHFFVFINNNDFRDNLKLKDITKFDSFENFRMNFVDKILENNRVKSLLVMLYNYNMKYFMIEDIDYSKKIYEIIARRNLHLHKNGIIDKNYFEQSAGNLFNLEIGNYAEIGYIYYQRAYNILSKFINNLANSNI